MDQQENETGTYQAFRNRIVKIRFADRTIVQLNGDDQSCSVITRLGQSYNFSLSVVKEDFLGYLSCAAAPARPAPASACLLT